MQYPKFHNLILSLVILGVSILPSNLVQASSPVDFAQPYGLTVHTENQNQTVTKLKGLQVLEAFFPDTKIKIDAGSAGFMSQRDFLLWFEKLRLASLGKTSRLSDDILYYKTWLEARRNNLLPFNRLTYQNMQEFLYRYSVSEKYHGKPYLEGLVLDKSEINIQRFSSLNGVREIKSDLFSAILRMKRLGVLSKEDDNYLVELSHRYEAFRVLEDQLKLLKHPFSVIADMPEDMKRVVNDNNLNEVLSSLSYDYSENTSNRIHNLVTGANKMHGRVYQPGEIIDFTKELGSNGWSDYQYGWVILGGIEAWQYGGGLCGSSTLTFTPSWKAGLEIVTRFPHSVYYNNLYPTESLGLDATIYRGSKNLIIKNSTNDPIMYYVKDNPEKKEITLYLIGNAPYYSIDIEGPIEVARNTYKWVRRMKQFDGTIVEDELTTKYGLVY